LREKEPLISWSVIVAEAWRREGGRERISQSINQSGSIGSRNEKEVQTMAANERERKKEGKSRKLLFFSFFFFLLHILLHIL